MANKPSGALSVDVGKGIPAQQRQRSSEWHSVCDEAVNRRASKDKPVVVAFPGNEEGKTKARLGRQSINQNLRRSVTIDGKGYHVRATQRGSRVYVYLVPA